MYVYVCIHVWMYKYDINDETLSHRSNIAHYVPSEKGAEENDIITLPLSVTYVNVCAMRRGSSGSMVPSQFCGD